MSVSVRGISSGIDINSIIEELMELERQPIRRKEAQIERTEQIAELWREVNARLDTLSRTLPPLQNRLTFTAPVPKSGNEEVLTARVSGTPVQGNYRFEVSRLANYHTVASKPPNVAGQISNPNSALGLFGTFHLSTGRPPEGLENLTFEAETNSWLRGNMGGGFHAVLSGSASESHTLNPADLVFSEELIAAGATEINIYLNSFTDGADGDLLEELEAYYTGKGWPVDMAEPLFTMSQEGGDWVAYDQSGQPFTFLGDHPLGTFGLRGEIVDETGEVLAINQFNLTMDDDVNETNLITIGENDSLLTVVEKVNARAADTGVIAAVVMANEGDYRLVLESVIQGGNGQIQAYDYEPLNSAGETRYGNDQILTGLNLINLGGNAAAPDFLHVTEAGHDAVFTLNGLEMVRSSNTLTDVISGLELTLTGEGRSTLEVVPDHDAAVEEIKLFVESINEVNSYLRVLQKDKEGPLQGSSDLMRIERQLRTLMHGMVPDVPGSNHVAASLVYAGAAGTSFTASATGQYTGAAAKIELTYHAATQTWRHNGKTFHSGDSIEGVRVDLGSGNPSNLATLTLAVAPPSEPLGYNSLASIGIMASDEEGILVLDESKLRAALADDPEGIFKLFGREAVVDSTGFARGTAGLAHQLQDFTRKMVGANGVVQNRQNYLQRQVSLYQDRIEMLERRLEIREERLVRQFTFMEQYIARIQEQTGLMATFDLMMQQNRQE